MSSPYEAYLREMIEKVRADLERVEAEIRAGRDGGRRKRLKLLQDRLQSYEMELASFRRGLQHLRRELPLRG